MKSIIKFIQKFFFLLIMALLFTILLLAAAFGQTPEQFRMALKHAEREQDQKALLSLALPAATAADHFYRGYIFLKIKDIKNAHLSFNEGIAANEKDPLNYAGMGYLLMLENKTADAKVLIDKALALSKSKNTQVLKVVAEAYLTKADYAGLAVNLLEKSKEIANKDAETDLLLGDAFLLQNNGGLAVTSYEHAAKADPGNPAPHYRIGMTYVRSKNFAIALEELNKAVSIDPSYTPAWKELAELYYLTKDGDKAVAAQENYLRLTEKPEEGQLKYAFYLFMAKQYSRANQIFEKVTATENPSLTTYRFYARSLAESGDTLSSIRMYDQYFAKAKSSEIAASDYSFYADMLKGLRQDSLAVIYYETSLAIEGNQPEVLQLAGDIYYRNKKYPEAIRTYRSLITRRTKPMSQDYYNLGRAYYYNSEFANADSAFIKLTTLQSNHAAGYLWSGRAKSNLDPETEQGLAKSSYEKVIDIAQNSPDKTKNELIEAYSYLGYYYFLKEERELSRSCWEKVLALNPSDQKAREALKALQ